VAVLTATFVGLMVWYANWVQCEENVGFDVSQ